MVGEDSTEKWVARLNRLAREIDETADSLHPSCRMDATAADRERWKNLAAVGP